MRRTSRSAALQGLIGSFLVAAACAPATSPRRDALWREYRRTAESTAIAADAEVFHADGELERGALIAAVLARNPEVAAAREALRAALAGADAAGRLGDPMVTYELAPLSVAGGASFGQRISVRQALPFPGKRRLAREAALAAAEAEAPGIRTAQLELAQMASELFDEYFVVERALEINEHHRALMTEMRAAAEAQYVVGRAAQQDPIRATVELAELERDRLKLESERAQIIAQLNGLLHRVPDATLPRPPAVLELAVVPAGTSAELQQLALERRPQRAVAQARIRAAEAEQAMAKRDFYPDVEVMTAYDGMWEMPEHRWMVGVMVEVPLQRGRRRAAVDKAAAEADRMRLEDARLVDELRVEVDRAHRAVLEATQIVELNEKTLIPATRDQLAAARAGFASGRNDFMAAIAAEEALREAELELEMSRAELSRRRAALARAVGIIPGMAEGGAP